MEKVKPANSFSRSISISISINRKSSYNVITHTQYRPVGTKFKPVCYETQKDEKEEEEEGRKVSLQLILSADKFETPQELVLHRHCYLFIRVAGDAEDGDEYTTTTGDRDTCIEGDGMKMLSRQREREKRKRREREASTKVVAGKSVGLRETRPLTQSHLSECQYV